MEYTVKSGDTLSHLAQKFLGNGNRWPEIYQENYEAITKEQRLIARKAMPGPDWIFPGTTLKITVK